MAAGAPTQADALRSFFMFVRDNVTNEVTLLAVPSDTQIGRFGDPSELTLTGRLSLATNDYPVAAVSNASQAVTISEQDGISSVYVTNALDVVSASVSCSLPTSPRRGTLRFLKDASGTSDLVPLSFFDPTGATIDGSPTMTFSDPYSSAGIYWAGTEWKTVGGGGGGGSVSRGVKVENNGTLISSTPFNTLNFSGSSISVLGAGSTATVGIPSLMVQNQGTNLPEAFYTTLNFTGSGIVASDGGSGVAIITVNTPSPAAVLDGLEWLLPRIVDNGSTYTCAPEVIVSAGFGGDPGTLYNVTLRFRGVVEEKTYNGGFTDGTFWQVDGTPAIDNWNIYSLTISDPTGTYYLNRGTSGLFTVFALDYTRTIPIRGGATVTLTANSVDSVEIANSAGTGGPLSIPGISNPPQPYAGQFIVMNVVSASAAGRIVVENNGFLLASGAYSIINAVSGVHAVDDGTGADVALLMIDNTVVATLTGSTFSGPVVGSSTGGFTGSLTRLVGGQPYIVGTGAISVSTGSNGQVILSASISGSNQIAVQANGASLGGPFSTLNFSGSGARVSGVGSGQTATITYYDPWNDNGSKVFTTSSVSIDSSGRTADQLGTDAFFFVSGTIGLGPNAAGRKAALFGGAVYVSGSIISARGFSGSLTQLSDGATPYIVGQGSVTVSTNSAGQVVINGTGTGGGSSGGWTDTGLGAIFTTSSISVDGTGRTASQGSGADTWVWLSGTLGLTGVAGKIVVLGGDSYFSGSAVFKRGLSGSLQVLSDGATAYLVPVGNGIGIVTSSAGQLQLTNLRTGDDKATYALVSPTGSLPNARTLAAGTGIVFSDGGAGGALTISANGVGISTAGGWTDAGNKVYTTGSVAIDGGGGNQTADHYGSDVFFYVSGTIGVTGSNASKAVFAGDTVVSGNIIPLDGGWVTVLDLDFTIQPAQTFSSDGGFTVAGYKWIKGNTTGDATNNHPIINPGVGLQFFPQSTSDYNGSTRTLPYLWTSLSGAIGSNFGFLDWQSKMRLYISIGTNNVAATFDNFVIGLDTNSTTWGALAKMGFGTGANNPSTALFWQVNASNTTGFFNSSTSYVISSAPGVRTFCFEFGGDMSPGPAAIMEFRSGSTPAGSAFPMQRTFSPGMFGRLVNVGQSNDWTSTTAGYKSYGSSYLNGGPWGALGIFLGMQRAGSSTALTGTYQRIRLDIKP